MPCRLQMTGYFGCPPRSAVRSCATRLQSSTTSPTTYTTGTTMWSEYKAAKATIFSPHVTSNREAPYIISYWSTQYGNHLSCWNKLVKAAQKTMSVKSVGSVLHFSFPSSCRWEMPKEAKADEAIFQMGRDYQLPHSYLVFRHFRSNLTGMYKCRLLFRQAQVGSHIVHLSLDESTHSSRICPH